MIPPIPKLVPIPPGFRRAKQHEITTPVLKFSRQALEDVLPVGKHQVGVIDGPIDVNQEYLAKQGQPHQAAKRLIVAQSEYHYDNHPTGGGPEFWHPGISLLVPIDPTVTTADQISGEPMVDGRWSMVDQEDEEDSLPVTGYRLPTNEADVDIDEEHAVPLEDYPFDALPEIATTGQAFSDRILEDFADFGASRPAPPRPHPAPPTGRSSGGHHRHHHHHHKQQQQQQQSDGGGGSSGGGAASDQGDDNSDDSDNSDLSNGADVSGFG
jgi:uncharacterized membrane protein YgcG